MTDFSDLSNSTYKSPQEPYFEKYWLFCESVLVLLAISTSYLLVCLVKHAVQQKRSSGNGKIIWQKKWLSWLPVVSSVFLLLRICSDHVSAYYGWRDDELCLITVTISTVLFALALYPVYIFLWVRQSIFYADPLMKEIIKPLVTYVSWFTLGFMLLSGMALSILYNLPQATQWIYKATQEGCKEVSVDSPEIIPGIVAAATILFQVTLLALFIYPLLSRETARFRSGTNGGNDQPSTSLSHSDEHKQQNKEEVIVFHASPDASPPSHRPQSPLVKSTKPISPLVTTETTAFVFTPRGKINSIDTDNESVVGLVKDDNDSVWEGTSPTIKRGSTMPVYPGRAPKRKTIMERVKSVKPGSIFYRRDKSNSVSSENMESPAGSDTESRHTRRGGTLKRKTKKDNERGRNLVTMMKKYAILMLICVVTDLVSAVIQIIFVLPELIYLVIFDVNLLINLLCVAMTFPEWQRILLPCVPTESESSNGVNVRRLRRHPTPLKRRKTQDRVVALKEEGRKLELRRNSSRRSSGSGYDSDSIISHPHIYKHRHETKSLLKTSKV